MAEAHGSHGEVLCLRRVDLEKQLKNFPDIHAYMQAVAEEKLKNHLNLIDQIIKRFNDSEVRDDLIKQKMQVAYKRNTIFMSLKRQVKRKK